LNIVWSMHSFQWWNNILLLWSYKTVAASYPELAESISHLYNLFLWPNIILSFYICLLSWLAFLMNTFLIFFLNSSQFIWSIHIWRCTNFHWVINIKTTWHKTKVLRGDISELWYRVVATFHRLVWLYGALQFIQFLSHYSQTNQVTNLYDVRFIQGRIVLATANWYFPFRMVPSVVLPRRWTWAGLRTPTWAWWPVSRMTVTVTVGVLALSAVCSIHV